MMWRLFILLAIVAALPGCERQDVPPVVATNVVVTAPASGMPMAAGYLDISNHSGTTLRITDVSSPDYASVEMHETVVEDDVARMRAIPVLEIEDGGTVIFEPGGKHLMLMLIPMRCCSSASAPDSRPRWIEACCPDYSY
jgi:copper(I)-binding protein